MHSSILFLTLAALASARTDLSGCTSSTAGPSLIWYVPGTGELCDPLDCGGGRAPPKTTVPGCPLYSGTATYSPSFLAGFGSDAAGASSTPFATATTTSPSSAMITGSSTTEAEGSQITLTGTVSPSSSSAGDSSAPSQTSSGSLSMTTSTSSSGAGSQSSSSGSSSTRSSSGSSSSGTATTSGAASTNTPNAGAVNSVHGLVGAVAAGFAFLL